MPKLKTTIAALALACLSAFALPYDALAQKIARGATLHRLPFDLAVAREHIAAACRAVVWR